MVATQPNLAADAAPRGRVPGRGTRCSPTARVLAGDLTAVGRVTPPGTGVGLWRKATYSGSNGGGCVEVTGTPDAAIAISDSKDPDGPRLAFTAADWRAFLCQVKDGQLA